MSIFCVFKVVYLCICTQSRKKINTPPIAICSSRHCILPYWTSLRLIANQKAHSSTDCEELLYAHGILAGKPHFALLLHLFILFSSLQQQAVIKATKMNQSEDCRPCHDGGTGQCIYANFIKLIASNSLHHCTILVFFTPHCIFGYLCVRNQLLCAISLSLFNTVQRCIILILVYKLV